ncbi:MAG TPA: ATP-dependent zinc metalloprotease FtsH [Oculatellaceae cyanobacterium]
MPNINSNPPQATPNKQNAPAQPDFLFLLILWGSLIWFAGLSQTFHTKHLPYSEFLSLLESNRIKQVEVSTDKIAGSFLDAKDNQRRDFDTRRVPTDLAAQLSSKHVEFSQAPDYSGVLNWVIPLTLFFVVLRIAGSRMAESAGSPTNPFGFGKSRARIYKETDVKTTFADVAGVDEAKQELEEIIDFLKNPEKFKKLGGRLPKGVLLVGPPGTGKTLLAKAVAGEAKRPFLFITGSEFVELYVGVGAARVRDLFEQAGQNAPCIVFIDELDALGRSRGIGPMAGGHDEKEQTLNQLLAELDGFDPKQGIILLAATNRPEVLDPALLRAGRFDRQILVDRPDKRGRVQILKVHLRQINYDESVQPEEIAAMTTGFTGADIANLTNEAAWLAARRDAEKVTIKDFQDAIERIVAGLEKKNRIINSEERKTVAFHEMGHALVGLILNSTDPVEKVSIIPRGIGALGYTIQRPLEDRFLLSESELKTKLAILMAGRAAEFVKFHSISTGASDDLEKATELARHMVGQFGMSKKLGMVTYEAGNHSLLQTPDSMYSGPRRYSEETAREIDCEIRRLLSESFERASDLLLANKVALENGANLLIDKETLTHQELRTVLENQFREISSTQINESNGHQNDSDSQPERMAALN